MDVDRAGLTDLSSSSVVEELSVPLFDADSGAAVGVVAFAFAESRDLTDVPLAYIDAIVSAIEVAVERKRALRRHRGERDRLEEAVEVRTGELSRANDYSGMRSSCGSVPRNASSVRTETCRILHP